MSVKKLGLVLFVVSFGPWLGAFVVPFLPLPIAQKAVLAPVLFVIGEGMFWLSMAILGKEAAARYGRWLSPRLWKLKLRRTRRRRSRRA
jgi:hypothetical protein